MTRIIIRRMLSFFLFYLLLTFNARVFAAEKIDQGLVYSRHTDNNRVIHILTIDPKLYRFELVKAHNQTFGRETVESIAKRKNAIAAINGGFFEMGESDDGRPSGTLIIDGHWIALAKGERALLSLSDQGVQIDNAEIKASIQIDGHSLEPDKINQYAKNDDIVLFNSHFGPSTLTSYDNRKEILIDQDYSIKDIIPHGDNAIPPLGFILSVPGTFDTYYLKVKQKANIDLHLICKGNTFQNQGSLKNILMGIPLLVKSKKSIVLLSKSQNNKEFSEQAHARSALGIKTDGSIVWVVVEHQYKQALSKVTLEDIQDILKIEGYSKKQSEDLTFASIASLVRKHYANQSTIGLTLSELADFMIGLGCQDAINLDGGGSSTLYLKGRIANLPIGDSDEAMAKVKQRPVSDAIIITKGKFE